MNPVFQNLITNCLYYTSPERKPVIQVSARCLSSLDFHAVEVSNGPYAEITIVDNGLGFDQKYAEKIFQIFQRLQPKGKVSGTGIGLSIVKKIIDTHGGIIKATGVENQGATFTFIIPADQA